MEKVPKNGSSGELYRDRQILHQIPKQVGLSSITVVPIRVREAPARLLATPAIHSPLFLCPEWPACKMPRLYSGTMLWIVPLWNINFKCCCSAPVVLWASRSECLLRFRQDCIILFVFPLTQDLALAYCKHVEKENHSAYEDFVNARNEVALDVGFVSPIVIPATVSSFYYTLSQKKA